MVTTAAPPQGLHATATATTADTNSSNDPPFAQGVAREHREGTARTATATTADTNSNSNRRGQDLHAAATTNDNCNSWQKEQQQDGEINTGNMGGLFFVPMATPSASRQQ